MAEKLRSFIIDYVVGDALAPSLSRENRLNLLLCGMTAGMLLSMIAASLGW